jgi:hypothetical protein
MKKFLNIFFPQKGKEKPVIRLYVVLLYTGLILGTILSFAIFLINTGRQNVLDARVVQEQLSWALLDPAITSETVQAFYDSKIYDSERDLSQFANGYEYKYHLLNTDIPKLTSNAESLEAAENIIKVRGILEKNIDDYISARAEIFSPSSALIDGLLFVIMPILPLFLFFRAIGYRVLLYIVFGNVKNKNEIK